MRYSSGPVRARERIASLDILRGIAVLGILVMNVYAFAMPFYAYGNPLAGGGTELHNLGTWFVTHLFFDLKFMSIFSMLFGAGIILMANRAAAREARFATIFYRRQFWLMLIGLAHAYLIWFGDILFFYALCGMLVYLLHKRTARTQLLVACLMLPVVPLLNFGIGTYTTELKQRVASYEQRLAAGEELGEQEQAAIEEWQELKPLMLPGDEEYAADVAAYTGSYADAMSYRVPFVASLHSEGFLFFGLWRIGGLMLIGMALMQLGVLDASRSDGFYRSMVLAGYGIGMPLVVFSAVSLQAHDWDPLWTFRIGYVPNYFGSVAMAFGHIGVTMLIVRSGWWAGLMARLAAVGRMALSNYLLQSVVMTTIFYGHGLGWYTQFSRLEQMGFVAGLLAVQLVVSPWWLSRFRFGPVEWLWRSLTYWRRQPLRRSAASA
ncbi:MAG: DUF418 domain-containing protein [Woeseiaceae bacterium]|nr:DUF418 domain-containing protein [Woeseiaceae bacterium]